MRWDTTLLGGFDAKDRARLEEGENFAIWGWDAIAAAIERKRDAAMKAAERDVDPLLVEYEGARVFVRAFNVLVWRQNQRYPLKRRRELQAMQRRVAELVGEARSNAGNAR